MVSGAIAGSCLMAYAPTSAAVVRVDRIRTSTEGDRTRVVIDVSRPAQYSVQRQADSLSMAVSFREAVLSLGVGEIAIGTNGLRAVRPRVDAGTVDIVLELENPADLNVFTLPKDAGKPDRVVIDLWPAPARTIVAPPPPATTPAVATTDSALMRASSPAAGTAPDTTPSVRTATSASGLRSFVVAVDAGHGGHDAGAMGRYGLVEKKLCLDLARRVAEILNRSGNVRAVLTRDDDEYLTLPRRNEIAEQKGADVFVSIHLNTAPSRNARGAEIYFVAPAGAQRAASQALESGEAAHDFGLEERANDDIVHMLLDVNQQAVLARSELLAESILESVRGRDLMPTRAVKQKSFSVLRTISMPSVLVEAGFISNNADAKLVKDPNGREKIARAIADGVLKFFRAHPPQRVDSNVARTSTVHRVQAGDTLWLLSRKYGTSVARLRELNGLTASEEIRVGQEIIVPGAN
jgi:N-acetylmuramoyl-L-alanine amidase